MEHFVHNFSHCFSSSLKTKKGSLHRGEDSLVSAIFQISGAQPQTSLKWSIVYCHGWVPLQSDGAGVSGSSQSGAGKTFSDRQRKQTGSFDPLQSCHGSRASTLLHDKNI